MNRNSAAFVSLAPAAIGAMAAVVAIVAGTGVIEAIAVGAVIMTIGTFVGRSLIASPGTDAER